MKANPPTAIYDANVLYSAPVRDLFLRLAQGGLVRARWTAEIHNEWMRNVVRNRPDISPRALERTRRLMDESIPDCVVDGYQVLTPGLALPDPGDCHVLAAAIHAKAGLILTFNLKHFPSGALSRYRIEAQHPDDFLLSLLATAPDMVHAALERQRESLRNPPMTMEQLLSILATQGLAKSIVHIR